MTACDTSHPHPVTVPKARHTTRAVASQNPRGQELHTLSDMGVWGGWGAFQGWTNPLQLNLPVPGDGRQIELNPDIRETTAKQYTNVV